MRGQGLCGAEILHPATDLAKNQYRKFQDPEGAIMQTRHLQRFFFKDSHVTHLLRPSPGCVWLSGLQLDERNTGSIVF